MQRGKLVIVFMLAVAFALAAYAWWHQFHRDPKSKQFWGTDGVLAIQYAPRVAFLKLSPGPGQTGGMLAIGDSQYKVSSTDISRSPGLVHVRHALLNDSTFEWDEKVTDIPTWDFALVFVGDNEPLAIAFTANCDSLIWVEAQKQNRLTAESAAAFRKKRDDWMTNDQ